jgi:hypothetical protein
MTVERPSKRRAFCVNQNQPDAQFILSIFRQPLHVSGVSKPIISSYNHMYTAIDTYCTFYMSVCLLWLDWNPTKTVFYTPDDGRMTPETCRESLQ